MPVETENQKLKNSITEKQKKYIIALIGVILLVIIWITFRTLTSLNSDGTSLLTVKVSKGNIEETVTAQGKLEPKEYVDVGTQVSGQLRKIYFEIGEKVKAGELVAEIDPRIYQAQVQAIQARLKSLDAQLAEQKAHVIMTLQHYQRNERLIKSNAISQELLQDSTADYNVAAAKQSSIMAQIEEAKSTLTGAQTNLNFTKIYAPINGTVVSQSAREGQTLNANQSAPLILQLANLDIMTVRAQVSEADVMRLKPNMKVYFNTLGAFDQKWKSVIAQILPAPEIVNDVVLYSVLIDVDNKKRELMTGMSAQVFFIIGQAKDALLIPVQALGKRLPEMDSSLGQAYQVQAKTNLGVQEKTVHIDYLNRSIAEVHSGLVLDEEVVIPVKTQSKNTSGAQGYYRGPRL